MNKPYFLSLLLLTLLLFGCGFMGDDPTATVRPAEETIDIAIDRVIRSGEFEERAETEVLPQNNCENKSSFSFSVSRERTLEQSINLTLKKEGGGELELAGKPLEVGASGKIIAAIGVEYGHNSGKAISDLGGMEFTIEPGDFPVYTIVWREKWEKGYVTIQDNDEEIEIPYTYLTTARPELINVEYRICPSGEPPRVENTPRLCLMIVIEGTVEGLPIAQTKTWSELGVTTREPQSTNINGVCSRTNDNEVKVWLGYWSKDPGYLDFRGEMTPDAAISLVKQNPGQPIIIVPWGE